MKEDAQGDTSVPDNAPRPETAPATDQVLKVLGGGRLSEVGGFTLGVLEIS